VDLTDDPVEAVDVLVFDPLDFLVTVARRRLDVASEVVQCVAEAIDQL